MSRALPFPGASAETGHSRAASSPIRVVLADDHDATRRTLRLLLDAESDVEVVAEATDLFTATRYGFGYKPRVLLLDLRMPGGSSWDVIRLLHAQAPDTEIVVVTMENSPAIAQKAIDLGAIGYVVKDTAEGELPAAIRCAAKGQQYVSSGLAGRVQLRAVPVPSESGPQAA